VYTLLCFFRFNNRAVVLFKRGGHERAQMKRKTHSNSTLLRCKLTGVVLLGTGLSTVRIGLARTVYIYTVYDQMHYYNKFAAVITSDFDNFHF
jgi:hypothetical protein